MFHLNLCEEPNANYAQDRMLSLDEFSPHYHKSQNKETKDFNSFFNSENRISDSEASLRYYNNLLNVLHTILNDLHGTHHSRRYWEILAGHWLQMYVDVLINRNAELEELFSSYQIAKMTLYALEIGQLSPLDTQDFISLANERDWNMALYSKMLVVTERCRPANTTFKVLRSKRLENSSPVTVGKQQTFSRKILGTLRKLFTQFSRGLVMSSYLPRNLEWLLSIRFLSFPQNGYLPFPRLTQPVSLNLRESMVKRIGGIDEETFEKLTLTLLPELLPTVLLEGYQTLINTVKSTYFPRTPKFAFTSNDFETNEFFKAWVAENTEKGMKYIVGQHGNNYGTTRFPMQKIEERTADAFLTWGWSSDDKRFIPAFNFKNPSGKRLAAYPKGGLLLTQIHYPIKTSHWDSIRDFVENFHSQMNFLSDLTDEIRAETTVRLHPAHTRFQWDELNQWSSLFPEASIDLGVIPITKLMSKKRLIVHGYDSTGLLESLSANFPTLCFMPNGFWNIREDALPYYLKLEKAGIIHRDPSELAQKVSEIWNDVESWWNADDLQRERRDFCAQYARSERYPLLKLSRIIANHCHD
jgi:putative transferase (TIGR04331 family)